MESTNKEANWSLSYDILIYVICIKKLGLNKVARNIVMGDFCIVDL